MLLHVWTTDDEGQLKDEYVLYIPYGVGLVLPGNLFHAGGYLFGENQNQRVHFSLVPGGCQNSSDLLAGTGNDLYYQIGFDLHRHFEECLLRRLKYFLLEGNLAEGDNEIRAVTVYDPNRSENGKRPGSPTRMPPSKQARCDV